MKYKGLILVVLIAIAVATLIFVPDKKIYEEIAAVGKPAPEFEYPDSNGKLWKLSDLKGKVVFINFWATWCTTCKAEMSDKEALYQKMQGKPFQMLGILFRDDPRNLVDYYREQKVSPPTLISAGNEAAKLYGITGVPESFVIDKEGIVREKWVGGLVLPNQREFTEVISKIEKWL